MSIDSTVLRWQAEAERLKQALSDEKHMHACTAGDAQAAINKLESSLTEARALLDDALGAINQDAWTVLADGIRSWLAANPESPRAAELARQAVKP